MSRRSFTLHRQSIDFESHHVEDRHALAKVALEKAHAARLAKGEVSSTAWHTLRLPGAPPIV